MPPLDFENPEFGGYFTGLGVASAHILVLFGYSSPSPLKIQKYPRAPIKGFPKIVAYSICYTLKRMNQNNLLVIPPGVWL